MMNSNASAFDPLTAGPLTLRNRFIKSGANAAMSRDGLPTALTNTDPQAPSPGDKP